MNSFVEKVQNVFSSRKGKAITGTAAAMPVIGVAAIVLTAAHRPAAAVAPASTSLFASAPAVEGSSGSNSPSSNPLSVSVNMLSSKQLSSGAQLQPKRQAG